MREEVALELYKRAVNTITRMYPTLPTMPSTSLSLADAHEQATLPLPCLSGLNADTLTELDEGYRPPYPMDAQGVVAFFGEITSLLQDFGMSINRGREDTKKGKSWWILVSSRLLVSFGLSS